MQSDKLLNESYKSIVVLANPKTILNARYAKKEIKQMVIRADQLNSYIKEVYQESNVPTFNDKELLERAESLLALHTPSKSDYYKKYEEIINAMSNTSVMQSHKDQIVNAIGVDSNRLVVDAKTINKEDELIKKLKEFRLQKSRQENLKPYYIFNDNQMMDLISKSPKSKEELHKVSGFGQVKVKKIWRYDF